MHEPTEWLPRSRRLAIAIQAACSGHVDRAVSTGLGPLHVEIRETCNSRQKSVAQIPSTLAGSVGFGIDRGLVTPSSKRHKRTQTTRDSQIYGGSSEDRGVRGREVGDEICIRFSRPAVKSCTVREGTDGNALISAVSAEKSLDQVGIPSDVETASLTLEKNPSTAVDYRVTVHQERFDVTNYSYHSYGYMCAQMVP